MGNIVNTVKRFSNNNGGDIPFQRCYNVPIGRSRLNKCTCIDNDSSLTGKIDSATKGSTDGCEGFHKEIGNDGMGLTTSITSAGCSDDSNFVTLSTAHAEQSCSDEANKDREIQNETINTVVGELGFDEYSEKAGLIHSQTADHMLHNLENESTKTATSLLISNEGNCSKNPKLTDELENSPSIDTHESRELRTHRVSLVDGLSDHNVIEEFVDVLSSGYKISSEVASQGQEHERTQNKLLSDSIVPKTSDIRGMESTPKTSLKRRAVRKRTTIKASDQMLVPKENIRISVPSDMTCVEIEKEPTSPMVEQSSGDKVLQGTHMSSMIKTPLSYVHQSPLTRNKAKSLSVSTPESMKRSRSGRLIVPRLNPGSQNIIYGPDGILGITNLEVHFSQESNSEPPSKRRKRPRRLSPDRNRLLTF